MENGKTAQTATESNSRIENVGLDVIAESERKGKAADLFMPWFASNISVLGLSWGAWILGFGISLWEGLFAGLLGVVISFLLCGIIAILGKRGSAPTLALSRAAFGYHGNRLSAAISWMLTVGWETILCILATKASATILEAVGWHNTIGAYVVGFVIVVSLAAAAGILGFDTIMRVQTVITWITAVLTLIYLILVIPHIDWAALTALPSGGAAAVIGALVMVSVGFGMGWVNAAADYSRYLPRTTPSGGVVFWTTFGAALPSAVLVIFGVLLVGSDPALGEAIGNDPIGALTTILPGWFLFPFAITAILGLVGGIVMDLYSSGLSLLATGVHIPRPVATAIDATIMTIGTVVVVFFAADFTGPFQAFLTTLGVIIAAWAGVMIAEVVLRKKDYDEAALFVADGRYGSINWEAIILVVLGTIVGWGFIIDQIGVSWLQWQGYFLFLIGGRDGAWAWANLGVLFALLIGFCGHLLFGRKRVAMQEVEKIQELQKAVE